MKRVWESNEVRASIVRREVAIVAMACIVSFLAALLSVPDNVLATNHGGWITQDEIWHKTGNPHNIMRDVRVMPLVTLTITEGVSVIFSLGTSLYVDGDLVVSGTESEPVTFTSFAFNPQPGDWGSIHFNASLGGQPPPSQINQAIVEYGSSAIYVNNRTLTIHSSTIRNNLLGIDSYYAAITVEMNSIHDNSNDGINWTGASFSLYTSAIVFNNITNNGGNGINGSADANLSIANNSVSFNKFGIHFVDSTPKILNNNITNNSEDGIYFLRSGNGTSMSNNTIANNSKNGIWVNTSTVLIDNNTIDHNGLNGTYLVNYNGTLENNTVLNNSGSGMYFVDSSDSFVQYNNVTLNGIHGIYSYNSSITVRENNVTHNSPVGGPSSWEYGGIYVDNSSTLQIDHNRIENNTGGGILITYVTQANVTDNAISDHVSNYSMGVYVRGSRVNVLRNSMVRNYMHVTIWYYQEPQQRSRVENNTIVGTTSFYGIYLIGNGSSAIIANNSLKELWHGIVLIDSAAKVLNNHIQDVWQAIHPVSALPSFGPNSSDDIFNNTILNATLGIDLNVQSGRSGFPNIHNNTINGSANSYAGIIIRGYGSATPIIQYNTITNYNVGSSSGINVQGVWAHPQIVNNTIAGNYDGIYLWGGANATIRGCNIYDNTYRGVDNDDYSIIVNATENWWGHEDGPHDPSSIDFDYNWNPAGQHITDSVRYRWQDYGLWWLTSPAQW